MRWPILLRRVVGYSMAPTLQPGKLILVRTGAEPRLGDIVVALHNNKEVIKRVVDIDARGINLIGDNHSKGHDAGWVAKENVLGRAYYR